MAKFRNKEGMLDRSVMIHSVKIKVKCLLLLLISSANARRRLGRPRCEPLICCILFYIHLHTCSIPLMIPSCITIHRFLLLRCGSSVGKASFKRSLVGSNPGSGITWQEKNIGCTTNDGRRLAKHRKKSFYFTLVPEKTLVFVPHADDHSGIFCKIVGKWITCSQVVILAKFQAKKFCKIIRLAIYIKLVKQYL